METLSIAGREQTVGGWLLWDVHLGPPTDVRSVSWPGLGEVDFTTVQSIADPAWRVTMRLAESTRDLAGDDLFRPAGMRLTRAEFGDKLLWIVVTIPAVADFDEARDAALQETGARRLLVADEDPDGRWWIGVLASA